MAEGESPSAERAASKGARAVRRASTIKLEGLSPGGSASDVAFNSGDIPRQVSGQHSAVDDEEGGSVCVLAGQDDGLIHLLDLATGEEIRRFKGHTDWIMVIEPHWLTWTALSIGGDGKVFLWDVKHGTGQEMEPVEGMAPCCMRAVSVDWTEGKRRAITGNDAGRLMLWDLQAGKCEKVYRCHLGLVTGIACDWNKNRMLVGHGDESLDLLNMKDGSRIKNFKVHHYMVTTVSVAWHKARALLGFADGHLNLWDLRKGDSSASLRGHKAAITVTATQWKQYRTISGSADKTLRLWNLKTADCLRSISPHTQEIRTLSVDWELGVGLSSDTDGYLKLWETADENLEEPSSVGGEARVGGAIQIALSEVDADDKESDEDF
eukprot:TRINITY_DN11498_c0_g2_i1.p1 TRINITY_DN11498_c0_g2~~TRINITY_DN11498_c0_g2_i1.p1  ORF type:complete len:379 (+),score=77.91 TRINITY_DN11498_c0_g2_i1:159-1295(+)